MNDSLAIIGPTIIDGSGREPIKDGILVIEGKRIAGVGGPTTPVPPHAVRIVAEGQFLIPGMMNASMHLILDHFPLTLIKYEGRYDELAIEAAQITLKNGLTTVFDTWGPRKCLMKARQAINEGRCVGSRIFLSGNIVGLGGPLSDDVNPKAREVFFEEYSNELNSMWEDGVGPELTWTSLDEFRARLRQHAGSGVDFIRYAVTRHKPGRPPYIVFSPRMQKIIVEEGHRAGITVQTHASSVEGVHLGIEAGVDLMAAVPRQVLPPETVDTIVQCRVPSMLLANTDQGLDSLRERGPWFDIMDRNQRALLLAGATVLLSTDGGVISANTRSKPDLTRHSFSYEHLLVDPDKGHFNWLLAVEQKGMKAMDALAATTRDVARAYGIDQDLGTLEPGKIADVLILERNPLERAANYRSIAKVIKDGAVVDTDALPVQRLLTATRT